MRTGPDASWLGGWIKGPSGVGAPAAPPCILPRPSTTRQAERLTPAGPHGRLAARGPAVRGPGGRSRCAVGRDRGAARVGSRVLPECRLVWTAPASPRAPTATSSRALTHGFTMRRPCALRNWKRTESDDSGVRAPPSRLPGLRRRRQATSSTARRPPTFPGFTRVGRRRWTRTPEHHAEDLAPHLA